MATMQHKIFCVYQRRTWEEFKRVLSVAHASEPVERTENLEYRNQLSGVCSGAVYCSIQSIFFNHFVAYKYIIVMSIPTYEYLSFSFTQICLIFFTSFFFSHFFLHKIYLGFWNLHFHENIDFLKTYYNFSYLATGFS